MMPSEEEIQKLLPFTAHRIQIKNGIWTIPEGGDDPYSALSTRVVIERAGRSLAGKRILDLGCLEGGYSAAFSQMGAKEVVGIEVRKANINRCLLVKQCLGLENLHFHQEDVRNVSSDRFGKFNIVFAAGILYHLDDPYTFLKNISEMTLDFALIDTHIANKTSFGHGCSSVLVEKTFESQKFIGREAREYPKGMKNAELEKHVWTSWGNPTSFWLTEESLVKMLGEVGFGYISKVYVPQGYRCGDNCKEECRVIIVAKKDFGIKS
ncbi:MAG: class I SAM-dependent methyltransferase [Bacteroidota bacterium]|nr:class I SAM-dependent methyltransferase [Bacteroidota bacterium]